MRQQYRTGDAGVLEHYPAGGRVDTDSAFVTAYLYGTTTLFAREGVTLDTVDTAATCTAGSQTVTVAAVTGLIRSRRYWLVDALGNGHEVRLAGILSPTSVLLEEPARITAAAASGKLRGHGLRRALAALDTATSRDKVRVEWEYKLSTVLQTDAVFIDIVPSPFALDCSEADIDAVDANFGAGVGSYGNWRRYIEAARADIWDTLEGEGVRPECIPDTSGLRQPLVYRTLLHRYARDEQLRDHYSRLYREAWGRFRSSRAWYDADQNRTVDDGEEGVPGGCRWRVM